MRVGPTELLPGGKNQDPLSVPIGCLGGDWVPRFSGALPYAALKIFCGPGYGYNRFTATCLIFSGDSRPAMAHPSQGLLVKCGFIGHLQVSFEWRKGNGVDRELQN